MTKKETQTSQNKREATEEEQEKSFFSIIVHSFFIIPFLIAIFCALLFAGIHLLTREKSSAYTYLEHIKTGGLTKRWQGAFELSKILSNPKLIPEDERFLSELISAFEQAQHDDNRVRQYLALAMGRTGIQDFVQPIVNALENEKEENLAALIYSLGMLRDQKTAHVLYQYANHPNARIRSITIVALGSIGNPDAKKILQKSLYDSEANVQWGAAISLAQMDDTSGKSVILNLLNRNYLDDFPEVDPQEKNHLMISAIEAAGKLNDPELINQLEYLSKNDQNMKVRSAAFDELKN